MPRNKYVDFVSDKEFLDCVKWVCSSYPKDLEDIDMGSLKRNALDPFKLIFDMLNGKIDLKEWMKREKFRQADKTVNNRVGDFHQRLLGKVPGWKDLGRGNPFGIDLENKKKKIFIELKNKHNTVKGEDHKNVFDKLKNVADSNKGSVVYYAYIIPKRPGSGQRVWNPSRRSPDKRILEAWGSMVYEIVTGDKGSLKKTWKALPSAINDTLKSRSRISKGDRKKLVMIFRETIR